MNATYSNEGSNRKFAVVSGGLGYIGKWVISLLEAQGWEVICLVRPKVDSESLLKGPRVRLIEYDGTIESLSQLKKFPTDRTVFIHLAATSGKTDEIEFSDLFLKSNIEYGLLLTKLMIENGFRKFVLAESYWQFDRFGNLLGNSLYAVTKSAFSLILHYMSTRYLNATALVLYDVYGPDDPRGKFMNFLLNQRPLGPPIPVTEGNQLVDYIHIEDVARAFLVASESALVKSSHTGYSRHTIRSMRPMTLCAYVELAVGAMKQFPNVRWGGVPFPEHQIFVPWFPDEGAQLPGWRPIVKFEDGVRTLINKNV